MRIGFLLVVLAGAVCYTYVAFVDLAFLTRTGRLGPGFFPRIVGVAMIAFTIWALVEAMGKQRDVNADTSGWRDAFILIGLAVGYAVLLRLFGGFPATVVYLALALSILNRGKHAQNAVMVVAIPSAVYLLFDRMLNANMPPALFELPFL